MNHECPALAVDVICFHVPTRTFAVIERKYPPLGCALPGGFVDVGETVEQAARREMREELNVTLYNLQLLGVYSDPRRDPRKHVVSVAFVAIITEVPVAGDDAKSVRLVHVDENITYAFDHAKIIRDALDKGMISRD